MSPVGSGRRNHALKKPNADLFIKKKKKKVNASLSISLLKKHKEPKKEESLKQKPQLYFGKTVKPEEINDNYNPFDITPLEMRRIK